MTNVEKEKIANNLKAFYEQVGSQNKATERIKGAGVSTLSNMSKGKWDNITDGMWRKVAMQIGMPMEWVTVETTPFKKMNKLLRHSQEDSTVHAIIGMAGLGKTHALKMYEKENDNAYLISCREYWNRKDFLQEILRVIGVDSSGLSMPAMVWRVTAELKKKPNPLLMFDESDKLSDQVFSFFITFYNELENECGIVLSATSHLMKRIDKGLRLDRKGYKEIYSRIGRTFVELAPATKKELKTICMANNMDDTEKIKTTIENCEGDIRKVKDNVKAYRKKVIKEEAERAS